MEQLKIQKIIVAFLLAIIFSTHSYAAPKPLPIDYPSAIIKYSTFVDSCLLQPFTFVKNGEDTNIPQQKFTPKYFRVFGTIVAGNTKLFAPFSSRNEQTFSLQTGIEVAAGDRTSLTATVHLGSTPLLWQVANNCHMLENLYTEAKIQQSTNERGGPTDPDVDPMAVQKQKMLLSANPRELNSAGARQLTPQRVDRYGLGIRHYLGNGTDVVNISGGLTRTKLPSYVAGTGWYIQGGYERARGTWLPSFSGDISHNSHGTISTLSTTQSIMFAKNSFDANRYWSVGVAGSLSYTDNVCYAQGALVVSRQFCSSARLSWNVVEVSGSRTVENYTSVGSRLRLSFNINASPNDDGSRQKIGYLQ